MMRKLSVMLPVTVTIWRVLVITAVTALVQAGLFWFLFPQSVEGVAPLPEECLDGAHVALAAAAGLIWLTVMLCRRSGGGACRYTVGRLAVSERWLNFSWAIYYMGCLLIFWAGQIFTMTGLLQLYELRGETLSVQTTALVWYRQTYLHNLLPGADMMLWCRNFMLVVAWGLCAARCAMARRRGAPVAVEVLGAVALIFLCFRVELYDAYVMGSLGAIVAIVLAGATVYTLLLSPRADERSRLDREEEPV